jgi:hypothetical protein
MQSDILSLQEISPNLWQAKYQGNYGKYTIKIKYVGKKVESFSCSCPSDYYPCKHIAMIREAIEDIQEAEVEDSNHNEITVEEVLKNKPHQKLIDFVVQKAKYNPEFTNSILLEFIDNSKNSEIISENTYSLILRKALKKVHFSYEDLYEYYDGGMEIDVLDEWLEKAEEFVVQKRFDEAIAICKACIEEYSEWMEDVESDIIDNIDTDYQEKPFNILNEIISTHSVNSNELFLYCISEISKPKYKDSYMFNLFNDLLIELVKTDEEAKKFIAFQDKLWLKVSDISSREAENIINSKILIYRKQNREDEAQQLITENIQIERFRKEVVNYKIAGKKYNEAKLLINDFLESKNNTFYRANEWNGLLLTIAEKEKDIPTIRKISFGFIETHFNAKYYRIYKSSFKPDEWEKELQRLINYYEKNAKFYFTNSIADIFAEEKDAFKLMTYIEMHLSAELMDKYYPHLVVVYPNETLDLFWRAIDLYAERNTGRNHYEYIYGLLKKIMKLNGGKELVNTMVTQYKTKYKNRKAMIETLGKLKL